MEVEVRKNIENRRKKLRDILRDRGLVDEGCECGFWRSEHDDIGPAIGHGRCLLSDCPKFRWNPEMKLKNSIPKESHSETLEFLRKYHTRR